MTLDEFGKRERRKIWTIVLAWVVTTALLWWAGTPLPLSEATVGLISKPSLVAPRRP